jgi:hypothetical protein
LGLAPSGPTEGDLICVLFGCAFPVFLHPQGEHFEVVGVVFLHGYMDGKAVEEMKNGNLEKREFIWC